MPHVSNADLNLLISYLSRDHNLSQDLQDVRARLLFSSTFESLDDGLPTPQPLEAPFQVGP